MHPSALYGVILITIAHLTHSVDGRDLKCRQVLLKGQNTKPIEVNPDVIFCKGDCSADEIKQYCLQECPKHSLTPEQHEDVSAFFNKPDPCVAAKDFNWNYAVPTILERKKSVFLRLYIRHKALARSQVGRRRWRQVI